jgi:hypothetical protein
MAGSSQQGKACLHTCDQLHFQNLYNAVNTADGCGTRNMAEDFLPGTGGLELSYSSISEIK